MFTLNKRLLVAVIPLALAAYTSTTAGAYTSSTNVGTKTSTPPCNLMTKCTSAWSMDRKMRSAYYGPLFHVIRNSDSTSMDIGVTSYGSVDINKLISFCSATTCVVDKLYDQVGSNNLVQTTAQYQPQVIVGTSSTLPYLQTTTTNQTNGAYTNTNAGVLFLIHTWLEQTATSNLPTGTANKTLFEVSKINWSGCCGGFGMTENPAATDGGASEAGQMFSLVYLGPNFPGYAGSTTYMGVDLEQGYNGAPVQSFGNNAYGEIKYNASANTVSGSWNGRTLFSGQTPYQAVNTGSRITLGTAGDNTPVPTQFYEGIIASEYASSTEDSSVYSNQFQYYGK